MTTEMTALGRAKARISQMLFNRQLLVLKGRIRDLQETDEELDILIGEYNKRVQEAVK
jgi:hypothetical protein